MSDNKSSGDKEHSDKPSSHDRETDDERSESVTDRIDRINRNAFKRMVCRRLVGQGEHVGR